MKTGYKDGADTASARLSWQELVHAAAPALVYTVLTNVVHMMLAASGWFSSRILLQTISVSLCLLFFGWYAYRAGVTVRSRKRGAFRYPASFCYVMAVVLCGVVNNYLFSMIMSVAEKFSSGYWQVVQIFYNNDLWIEILTLCIIGPVAEELVYRGFVYQRLRENSSETAAAVGSALLFGVMHFNIVQGVYAFVLGILLAHIVYKTGSLLTAAAAHMAANLVSVLWTETDWLDFLDQSGRGPYAAAVLCLVLMGIFLSYGNQLMRHERAQ